MYIVCCGSNAGKIPCQIIQIYTFKSHEIEVYTLILQNFNIIFNKDKHINK